MRRWKTTAQSKKRRKEMSWVARPRTTRAVAMVTRFWCDQRPEAESCTLMDMRSPRTKMRVMMRGRMGERCEACRRRMRRERHV